MQQPAIGSVRAESRVRRRAAILEAALALVQEADFESLTMEAIASRAHLTKPTLYAYFDNKEAIVLAALSQRIHSATETLDGLASAYPPEEALIRFSYWMVRHRFLDGSVIFGMSARHLRLDPAYRLAKQQLIDRIACEIGQVPPSQYPLTACCRIFMAQFYLGSIREFNQSLRLEGAEKASADEVANLVTVLHTALFRTPVPV